MQQSDFELKNGYQMIPVAIAGVIAVAIGCVIHFFKFRVGNVSANAVGLFTAAGVLLLYGYDLSWMKRKIYELKDATSMTDVRFSRQDIRVLFVNLVVVLCYILLSVAL